MARICRIRWRRSNRFPTAVKATQTGFGDEIGRGAGVLSQSASRMAEQMEQAQDRLAATLAAFEGKIAGIAPAIASAAEQSTREAGSALLATLDSAAQVTEEASRTNSEQITARVESVAAALAAAASSLAQAGVESRAQMTEGMQAVNASGEESAARLTRMVEAFAAAVGKLSTRLDQTEQALGAHNEPPRQGGRNRLRRLQQSGAQAAGAMEDAAAPLTTATLTFRDAMVAFRRGRRTGSSSISASGDADRQPYRRLRLANDPFARRLRHAARKDQAPRKAASATRSAARRRP